MAVHLKPGPELDKATSEVANYKRFKAIVGEIVEVNEAICEARPASPLAEAGPREDGPQQEGSSVRSKPSSHRV